MNINVHLKTPQGTFNIIAKGDILGLFFNIVICCLRILQDQISPWLISEIFQKAKFKLQPCFDFPLLF